MGGGCLAWRRALRWFFKRSRFASSASSVCVASCGVAPLATSSRQRSSRCCCSSSTMSDSRSGLRRSEASRARSSGDQSGASSCMFALRDEADGLDERRPDFALAHELAAAFAREVVEAPAALAGFLDPRALDPAALFQAVEQRVQGVHVEFELAARAGFDELAQVVAVAGAGVEEGED